MEPLFEAAADAVVAGDIATLEQLLRQHPELIHARSGREHHATLLHYIGANGVEDARQKTPPNAIAVTQLLLQAGAEINAEADMYGGSTTLGLVATSIHPLRAGVQQELMELLLTHGAVPDAAVGETNTGGYTRGIVNACLGNGRPAAAEFLANHSARLDLEGAAGIGRLDLVQQLFAEAAPEQLRSGLFWACEYGHTPVVEFLLGTGVEFGANARGETALHWAAFSGNASAVTALLKRHAPVEAQELTWHGTPLGWALYGWRNHSESASGKYYEVVAALVDAGAAVDPQSLAMDEVQADPRMLAALSPRR